jgi:chemotaxis protein MotB
MHDAFEDEVEVDENEPWLLSFADMFTLLVSFFCVLLSMASFDRLKYEKTAEALAAEFSKQDEPVKPMPQNAIAVLDQTEVLNGIRDAVTLQGLGDQVAITMTPVGVQLTASSELLFASGQAEAGDKAQLLMRAVAGVLKPLPAAISVEGHTDDVPMHTERFPSNWELSTARASSMVRILLEAGIAPDRVSAVGYAETRPVARQDGAADPALVRAKNRRVVLLITKKDEAGR